MGLPLLCVLVLLAATVIPSHGSILNLNKMIRKLTGKVPAFAYWTYGCHCGLGGRGQPLDATDWCCKVHDCCYAHLRQHGCRYHTDNYKYNISQGDIQCSDKGSFCEQQLCACDKEVALCLKRNLDTYRKGLRFHWRSTCTGLKPKC